MTNDELQHYVERISLRYFNQPFTHKVFWNNRLKTTGGRYHLQTHHIDINPKVLKYLGIKTLNGVIKHELCHYHLHINGRGYNHKDKEFKQLLSQVGGARYVMWQDNDKLYKWVYHCEKCGTVYYRNRRIDVKKYVCSKCKGTLKLNEN